MSSFDNGKSEMVQCAKKYSRVALRYSIAFIIWMIKEIIILISYANIGLKYLWKYLVRYSILFWKWIKWVSPIVWKWTKIASVHAWHWICKASIFIWCWTKVLTVRFVRLMFVFFWHFDRWIKSKHEQYLEFKRTKGFRGLAKDVKTGMKASFNHYMDEDQIPSTEHVLSDDELLEEQIGNNDSAKIRKLIDRFVKGIVNEK